MKRELREKTKIQINAQLIKIGKFMHVLQGNEGDEGKARQILARLCDAPRSML